MSARLVVQLSGPDKDGFSTACVGNDVVEHRRTEWQAVTAVLERVKADLSRLMLLHGTVVVVLEKKQGAKGA